METKAAYNQQPQETFSQKCLAAIGYHNTMNQWFALVAMLFFVIFSVYFYHAGSRLQALLHVLLSADALIFLLIDFRFRKSPRRLRLKQISASIALGLLATSFIASLSSGQIFENSILSVMFLVAIVFASEKVKMRIQETLVDVQNGYKDAQRRQSGANLELKREIELRTQSQDALIQSEIRYRALFEDAAVSLWEIDGSDLKAYLDRLRDEITDDLDGYFRSHPQALLECIGKTDVIAVNRATLSLFGVDTFETLKDKLFQILPPLESFDYMVERSILFFQTGHIKVELNARRLDGHPLHLLVSTKVPAGYETSWNRIFTTIYDITERCALEQERQRVEQRFQNGRQLEAVATLAGGIAHQFNNALAVIYGVLDLLELKSQQFSLLGDFLKPLNSSAEHMSQLTGQLIAYAQGGKYQPRRFSVNDLIGDVLGSFKYARASEIEIISELDPELLQVEGDITQIRMVLEAILTNASESIQSRGCITISTSSQTITKPVDMAHVDPRPGAYTVIEICDTGIGMDEQTCARIFEPFFTTKFFGRGLGMAAAFGIVNNHDGIVTVTSKPNHGTRVTIRLPGIDANATQGDVNASTTIEFSPRAGRPIDRDGRCDNRR
ncbi:MAG: PAS domain-containing protein [Desulfatitalea sp.]|nr:PAS domain-containing protein [Desulfatitalea sp.]NNJ99150.1 PAS domain-containing protein [Desulfatitalea sp.]